MHHVSAFLRLSAVRAVHIACAVVVCVGTTLVVPPLSVARAAGECPSGWTYNSGTQKCSRTWTAVGYSESWTVPSGVTSISVTVIGARGGSGGYDAGSAGGSSGLVGSVSGSVAVTAGQSLSINVGGVGSNGANTVGNGTGGGAGGSNPLSGYDGGAGSNAGCSFAQCGSSNGNSGAGGGGGAASVLLIGGTTIVAAGGGGGGGASLYATGGTGRTGFHIAGTNGAAGDNNYPAHAFAGVGGGGGGGASGGAAGRAAGIAEGKAGGSDADNYSAEGGSAGSNSTGGEAGLTATFVTAQVGSITISYTPQLAPIATASPTVSASPVVGTSTTATNATFAGLAGTNTLQWLVCDASASASNTDAGFTLPEGCTLATGAGANTLTYTPALDDTGKYLRLASTMSNSEGIYTSISATSTNPVALPTSTPDLVASSDLGTSSTDNITSDNTPAIVATNLIVGATVTMTAVNGSTTRTCTFVATTSPEGCDLGEMSDGVWTVTSTQTHNAVTSTVSSTNVTIDTVAPTAPLLPDLATTSDLGASSTDDVTSDATPRINGGGVPNGVTVTMTASRPGYSDVTCTYVASASVSGCDLPTLADGQWTVVASTNEKDTAGNAAPPSPPLPITVRTSVGSGLAVDLVTDADTGLSSTDNLTNLATVNMGVPGVTAGDVVVMTATRAGQPSATCTYTASPTVTSCDLGPLTSGVWTVAATVTDPVANVSGNATALPITIDLEAPTQPDAPDLIAASDSGDPSTSNFSLDNITNDATPFVMVGAAEAGATVTLTASRPGAADVSCSFVAAPGTDGCDLATLSDGSWTVSAIVTDPAGNTVAAPSVLPLVIDTTAPVVPAMPDLVTSSDSGASSIDNITFDAAPTVSIPDVEVGAVVILVARRDGFADVSCSYVVSATVTSCDLGVLADGTWLLSGSAVDTAGNQRATTSPLTMVVDTVAPVAVNGPDLAASSDSGASDTDNLTFDNIPEIVVDGAETGATVTVTASRPGFADVTCTFVASATTRSCDLGVLADGPWTVTTRVADVADNFTPGTSSLVVTIDTVVPHARGAGSSDGAVTTTASPTVVDVPDLLAMSDSGLSSTDDVTQETDPWVSIPSAQVGDVVVMTAQLNASTVRSCTYVVSATVTSCQLSGLASGRWLLTATTTDRAGNTGVSQSTPFEVSTYVGLPAVDRGEFTSSIRHGGSISTITVAVPERAGSVAVRHFVVAVVDASGRVVRRQTMSVAPGRRSVSMVIPRAANAERVITYAINGFGVSGRAPVGAAVRHRKPSRPCPYDGSVSYQERNLFDRVIFNPASPELDARDKATLDKVARHLRDRGGVVIVSGYARKNGRDSASFLRNLSTQRSRNVSMYLSARGVRTWVDYQGYGAVTKEIGTWRERRVDVCWTEKPDLSQN